MTAPDFSLGARRKLATIFAADVAHYSTHIEKDEVGSLSQLAELRRQMDAKIAQHQGRVANTAGDSVIAVFESPLEAVLAAIEIQAAHKSFGASIRHDRRLQFRIGINIGDVTFQPNGDVLGAGVNIASRLESIAQPGGICVSENVFEQVDRRLPTDLRKLGEHYVKNIEKPVRVYAVGGAEESIGARYRRRLAGLPKKPLFQIAVALMAVLGSVISLLQISRSPAPEGVDVDFIHGAEFDALTPPEILAKFDLVTTGSWGGSTYHIIRFWGGFSMDDLSDLASALGGHVVSINSQEENRYLFQLSLEDSGHWQYFADETVPETSGPMIGFVQEAGSTEPDQGWKWLNGDPVTFLAWKLGGPENARGSQSLAQFRTPGDRPLPVWDDIRSPQRSVIIEVPEIAPSNM